MAYLLKDYYNTGDDSSGVEFYSAQWRAQTFLASDSYDAVKVSVKLGRPAGTQAYTVYCDLYATAAGLPSGAALETVTCTWQSLPTSPAWVDFVFVGVALTSGTSYAIVFHSDCSASYAITWRSDGSSPTYAGGSYCYSTNSGSSWTAYTNNDCMFEVYSEVSSYAEIAATGSITIAGTAALLSTGFTEIAATGSITIAGTAALTYVMVASGDYTDRHETKFLVVAGSDSVWIQD